MRLAFEDGGVVFIVTESGNIGICPKHCLSAD